jgi:hypothetical protein
MTYFLVIRTGKQAIFENVTLLITSALPTLVASQFKSKLPNENIVKIPPEKNIRKPDVLVCDVTSAHNIK